MEEIETVLAKSGMADDLAMVYIETPANPTNELADIELCAEVARGHSKTGRKVILAVDNTFLGPLCNTRSNTAPIWSSTRQRST